MTPRILLLQGAAIAASLFHVLVEVWLGLYGRPTGGTLVGGPNITIGQALTLVSFAALYAWWPSATAAATASVRGAMLALAVLAGVWTFVGNGLAPLAYCPPPCSSAFPWHDAAHLAGAVFGAAAAVAAWRAYRAMSGPTQLAPTVTAIVLMLASYAAQATSLTLSALDVTQ